MRSGRLRLPTSPCYFVRTFGAGVKVQLDCFFRPIGLELIGSSQVRWECVRGRNPPGEGAGRGRFPGSGQVVAAPTRTARVGPSPFRHLAPGRKYTEPWQRV